MKTLRTSTEFKYGNAVITFNLKDFKFDYVGIRVDSDSCKGIETTFIHNRKDFEDFLKTMKDFMEYTSHFLLGE